MYRQPTSQTTSRHVHREPQSVDVCVVSVLTLRFLLSWPILSIFFWHWGQDETTTNGMSQTLSTCCSFEIFKGAGSFWSFGVVRAQIFGKVGMCSQLVTDHSIIHTHTPVATFQIKLISFVYNIHSIKLDQSAAYMPPGTSTGSRQSITLYLCAGLGHSSVTLNTNSANKLSLQQNHDRVK